MAIRAAEPKDDTKAQVLYETVRSWVGRLTTAEQLALGMSLQRGAAWPLLSPAQQEAFAGAAEDLDL